MMPRAIPATCQGIWPRGLAGLSRHNPCVHLRRTGWHKRFGSELIHRVHLFVPQAAKNLAVLSTNAEIMVNWHFQEVRMGRHVRPSHSHIAGWSSPVAREAHNLEVAGSNPVPATRVFSRMPTTSEKVAFSRTS